MSSNMELIREYLTRYNDLLRDLELFDKEFPDSKAEHNFWVNVIARLRKVMVTMGIDDIEPIPPLK